MTWDGRRRRTFEAWLAAVLTIALVAGCSDNDEKPEIRIALLAPLSGALTDVGNSFVRVAAAAVEEINEKGGANGHQLVLVVRNTQTDADAARQAFIDTVEQDGVVAIVGPASSAAVANCYLEAARLRVPHISPSSTAPSLGDPAVTNDSGFLFRNVPDDSIQGLAQAYYLRVAARGPQINSAAIIRENGPYGDGLAAAFATAFETAGGDVPDSHIVSYDNNLPDQASADAVFAKVMALDPLPKTILMIALERDGLKITKAWDNNGSPLIPGLRWFLTDGARSAGFLAGMPSSLLNTEGTAPTSPIQGSAYATLVTAYELRNGDNLSDQVFGANVWDAVHVIAAAIGKQSQDEGPNFIGGDGLRLAITNVSRGPGQIFHAGQWEDMMGAIRSGSPVDYDGASGPADFDSEGESIGPYEVWRIVSAGDTNFTFEQVLFLEANEIQDLLNGI